MADSSLEHPRFCAHCGYRITAADPATRITINVRTKLTADETAAEINRVLGWAITRRREL